MKRVTLIITFLALIGNANAQAYEGPGDVKINAGLSFYGYGTGLNGAIDFGVLDWMSLGGGVDVYFSNPAKYHDDKFYIYGRINFHLGDLLNMPDKWDIYPGLELGVIGNTFGLGAHVGARYFFNDRFGLYTEIGNHGAIGVSFNL